MIRSVQEAEFEVQVLEREARFLAGLHWHLADVLRELELDEERILEQAACAPAELQPSLHCPQQICTSRLGPDALMAAPLPCSDDVFTNFRAVTDEALAGSPQTPPLSAFLALDPLQQHTMSEHSSSESSSGEAQAAASKQQVSYLEVELRRVQFRLEQAEGEHSANTATLQGLRRDLQASRAECEELRRVQDGLTSEVAQSRRRAERGAPRLAECGRRLADVETTLAQAKNEVAEERRAREKCHLEAIRAGERFRIAQNQAEQLRERVRAMEEVEMRYPSRQRKDTAFASTRLEPGQRSPPQQTEALPEPWPLPPPIPASSLARPQDTAFGSAPLEIGQRSPPQQAEALPEPWPPPPPIPAMSPADTKVGPLTSQLVPAPPSQGTIGGEWQHGSTLGQWQRGR